MKLAEVSIKRPVFATMMIAALMVLGVFSYPKVGVDLFPNIDMCWSEIAYFQSGDNPGRKEPYTGEINYRQVFKHIHDKGFKGVIGMEHGNSVKGPEGEMKVIEAYRKADSF